MTNLKIILKDCNTICEAFNKLEGKTLCVGILESPTLLKIIEPKKDYVIVDFSNIPIYGPSGGTSRHGIHTYGSSIVYYLSE